MRVFQRISELGVEDDSPALAKARELAEEIGRYRLLGDPEPAEAMVVQAQALDLAGEIVDKLKIEGIKSDRLGQSVRNLFECLAAGKEGADKGLEAGENPNSLQRP